MTFAACSVVLADYSVDSRKHCLQFTLPVVLSRTPWFYSLILGRTYGLAIHCPCICLVFSLVFHDDIPCEIKLVIGCQKVNLKESFICPDAKVQLVHLDDFSLLLDFTLESLTE